MPRTTHRSKSGKKLYAKRNKLGQFTDIQSYNGRTNHQAPEQVGKIALKRIARRFNCSFLSNVIRVSRDEARRYCHLVFPKAKQLTVGPYWFYDIILNLDLSTLIHVSVERLCCHDCP